MTHDLLHDDEALARVMAKLTREPDTGVASGPATTLLQADAPPPGIGNGRAPLLTDFLRRRGEVRARFSHVRLFLQVTPFPPTIHVDAYNAFADILSGRRPA